MKEACAFYCVTFHSVISLNCLVWKFCGKAQFLHNSFAENFHARKLGETTVFYAVFVSKYVTSLMILVSTYVIKLMSLRYCRYWLLWHQNLAIMYLYFKKLGRMIIWRSKLHPSPGFFNITLGRSIVSSAHY